MKLFFARAGPENLLFLRGLDSLRGDHGRPPLLGFLNLSHGAGPEANLAIE